MPLHLVAFDFTDGDFKQAGGARIAAQHPPDLAFDLAAIGLLLAALQPCRQPGQIIFDAFLESIMHGPLLLPAGVAAAHDKGFFALRAVAESDFDARLNLCPVLLEQLLLERTQRRLGCAHDVTSAALIEEFDVLLADHTSIQNPNPIRPAVTTLHRLHNLLKRLAVVAVAFEDLIGNR